MVAFSKVSSGRQRPAVGSAMLVAGAGASAFTLLPGQRSPGTAPVIPRVARATNFATSSAQHGMEFLRICGTGVAAGLLIASASTRSRQVHRKPIKANCQKMSCDAPSGGMGQLFDAAGDLLAHPEDVGPEMVKRIQMLAADQLHNITCQHRNAISEIMSSAEKQMASGSESQLRWTASAMATLLVVSTCNVQPAHALDQVNYTTFLGEVQKGNVEMVRVQNDMLVAQYTTKDGSRHEVNLVPNMSVEDSLFNQLAENKVDVVMQSAGTNNGGPLDFLTRFAGPVAWLIAGLLLLFGGAGMPGGPAGMGGQNPFQLGKSPAKVVKDGDTKVKFADVAGCDGAKEELVEVVDFLKNTSRYSELGAKIPKGALLVGPPGTGKTLLAKAVAGEAGVPFFSVSAAEFVEVFAGIGASRVRDLFADAKKSAPCIIFIDEIDAVGRQRSAGFGQGNDEREQTVNQLLTEMDGFEANNGVVVLAATNRADILDQALVRPGRFDRRIQVDPPDVQGRTEILKVHAQDKSLAPGVDLSAIARQTPGMSGADLSNLLNEGAIMAARKNKAEIDQDDIANALERISIGLEKKDAVMSEQKKKLVAYHEAGHALLGALMNDFDIVAKISIIPRGPAGGVTIFMPSEERLNTGLYSKEFLQNRMCVALGGRLAEEIINGKDNVTTGASNDFQQCTQVAQAMVMQLGMSETVGQRIVGSSGGGGGPFMGRDFMGGGAPPVSQALKQKIDAEVKRLVDEQYARGMELLMSNRYLLDKLAEKLLEQEKVGGEELMKMINEAAAAGKLSAPFAVAPMAVAACLGEEVTDSKKSRCLHPDKPVMFACSDCPRRSGKCADEPHMAVAAFLGKEVSDSKKSRCLHPDKPVMFACSDCPRRIGKCSEEPQMAVAACLGEETADSKKNRCLHPDKPVMFACSDCPRRNGKCSDEPQMAVAAFLGDEVTDSKKSRCLHPDKPAMFACSDCPRRSGKCSDEPQMAVASFLAEEVADSKKSRCLHPDKPVMFACSDCPRRSGKCSDEPHMAVASFLAEEVTDNKKSRCLHPDKPVMFACSDCPRRTGKCSDEPHMAVASFLGEEVTDSKKSRCLHPDKPVMFSCSDCPRRNGKCSDEPQMAVAAFLGEEATDSKKSRCLHPDKPVMFACSDCPRRSGKCSEEAQMAVAACLGEEAADSKKTRCLHPDKPVMFACSDCPRRSGKCSDEPQMAVAAFLGDEVTDSKKSRCLHPDKPVMFACSDCPRRTGKCSDEPHTAVASFLGEEVADSKKSRCLHPDKPVMFACSDCPRRNGKCSDEPQMAVASFLGMEVTDSKKSRCLHPDKPVMFACSDCPRRSGKCSDEPQMAVASFLGEEVTDNRKSRCLHPDKPVMFACSDCPRRGGKCAQSDEHDTVHFHLN